jgi:putative ABC transport system permease protein
MIAATLDRMIDVSWWQLGIAASLVLAAGVINLVLKLGLSRRIALASLRTVVQLLLVGYILRWVFNFNRWWPVVLALTVMIGMAARAAVGRSSRAYRGVTFQALLALVVSALAVTATVTQVIIGVKPWYQPQYVIPLTGMVLGNALTGISLCLDQLLETLDQRRGEVEMELSLGATRWEAASAPLRDAVRRGMIPIINSMMVVGVVSLPGMMTGQILAGADPLIAVKYQVVVMFMIAAGTSLGCMFVGLLVCRHLFNDRHQLRADRIRKKRS